MPVPDLPHDTPQVAPQLTGTVGRRVRPVYRVFVSSTWLDLQPERRALMEALNRMEEMRFVGMEFFGNRPDDTHDASINQVDLCEVFVGIIGQRYGSGITEAEYRRARALNLPCFVYFKRGELAGPEQADHDPELAQKLATFKQDLLRGHTVKEVGSPEELAASATADLHNWVAARWISLERETTAAEAPPRAAPDADRTNLLRLLDRIQHDWVEGVLEASLHRRVWIDLGLDWKDEAVDQPWDRILVAPDRPVRTLSSGETIGGVFAAAQDTLLILGEPGAGKTTTLLELTRALVARAREAPGEATPVVLALSTWTGRHRGLGDWLVEEVNLRYQVPKRLTQGWLGSGRLVLLLDGLDEVREDLRPACVAAINSFVREHAPAGLAVTCRVTEYDALKERLSLRAAICLQPLTPAQIDAYFARAGAGLDNLRTAMRADEALRTLAQTPLMLSVMTMAWRDAPVTAWHAGASATMEQRRRQLFDAYVQTALRRKGTRVGGAFDRQVGEILPWLAQQMKQRDQTLFALEQLQPDWLDGARRQYAYFFLTRLMATLGLALPFCLLPVSWTAKLAVLTAGAMAGMVLTAMDHALFRWTKVTRVNSPRDRALLCAFIMGIVPLVGLPMIGKYAGGSVPDDFLATLAVYGIILAVTLSIPVDVKTRDIRAADAIGWSWPQVTRRAGLTVMFWQWFLIAGALEIMAIKGWGRAAKEFNLGQPGFWPGLGAGLLAGGVWAWRWRQRGWLAVAGVGALGAVGAECGQFIVSRGSAGFLVVSLLLGLLVGLFGGLTSGIDTTRARRAGAWFWVKVPVLAALIVGLGIGSVILAIGFVSADRENWMQLTLIAALTGGMLGIVAFVRFGGLQGTQHFILRRLLIQSGRLPKAPAEFLDQTVRANLLQKVGFGYRFIHALLLDHFAELPAKRHGSG